MNKKHPFFWFLIVIGSFAMLLYMAVAFVVSRHGRLTTEDRGWSAVVRNNQFYVLEVDPDGFAAGKLQANDRIEAVNNNRPQRSLALRGKVHVALKPGKPYTLQVVRDGQRVEVPILLRSRNATGNLVCVISILAASAISFFFAMFIGLSKPGERVTQLYTLVGLSIALVQLIATLEPMESFLGPHELQLGFLIWLISLSPLSVAFAFDFFHRFPSDFEGKSKWRFVKYVLYVWAGSLAAYFTVVRLIMLVNLPKGIDHAMSRTEQYSFDIDLILNPLMLIALPVTCAVIAWNYKNVNDPQNRRRLRWVTFGSVAGITPTILYFAALTIKRTGAQTWITHSDLSTLFWILNLSLSLVPLTIGYAVIKHRVFGINAVLRMGFQYLLARHVLQILIYLPVTILIATILTNRDRTVLQILFSNTVYVFLTVIALVGLKFRKALFDLVDQKFFRQAYASEKILMQLINDVESMNSLSEISRAVSVQMESALHPKSLFVFYKGPETNELVLGYSSGEHHFDLRIPLQSEFLKAAESQSDLQSISYYKKADLSAAEQQWMEAAHIHLVVPVKDSSTRLIGLLLLGEKKSEEAYTPHDKSMLKSVARQIGVVYENLLLKQKVDRGIKTQRDVLSHFQAQNRNLLRECPVCGACYDSTSDTCDKDKAELQLTLPVERTIDGKYRVEKLLGRGGMGAVYEATDLRLHRRVAVKILVGSMFGDRKALARFEREARTSAKINHPNVVTIYDFGAIEGKGAYLVMELLSGQTLRAVLKERKHLDPADAAAWFDQIIQGVKASHTNGIIHRDLKPENVFVSKSESGAPLLKILDLGLAKVRHSDADTKSLTEPGTVLGTIYYMSPEQVAGAEVDERTDIFSLGVMIAEALTGRQPFTGNSIGEVAMQIIQKPFEFQVGNAQHARLNSALQKCLAKNRDKRYQTIQEMQEILTAIAECPPMEITAAQPAHGETIADSQTHTRQS